MRKKVVETKPPVIDPKKEEELILQLQNLKRENDNGSIVVNWGLGSMILSVYEKAYGEDKLQMLAKKTGFSKSALHKACQFAREFTQEQMEALTKGPFTLSWRHVACNMTVGAENLVKVFQVSKNLREFCNAVTKFKPPKGTGEKTKPKSRRELEAEIARLREILQIKDKQITGLNAEIDGLKKTVKQYSDVGIENDNIKKMEPVAA